MRMSSAASLKSQARLLAPQGRSQMRIHADPMHILSDVRNVMQGHRRLSQSAALHAALNTREDSMPMLHQCLSYSEPSTVAIPYPFSNAWHACQSSTWARQDLADAAGRGAAAEVLGALLRQPGAWRSASTVAAGPCQSHEGAPPRCTPPIVKGAVCPVSAAAVGMVQRRPRLDPSMKC